MSDKVTCPLCKRFLGLVTADGKGPIFDNCPELNGKCPMEELLKPFQPLGHPLGVGNTHNCGKKDDEDSGFGTYYTHGMTAEDQNG